MDSIKLRTLTYKSVLGYGKYSELSIGMMMQNKHMRSYLRWVYYNSSKISFVPEILDELRISEEFRFEKPGTNEVLHQQLKDSFKESVDKLKGVAKIIHENAFNKKARIHSQKIINKQLESKGKMMRRNHGK